MAFSHMRQWQSSLGRKKKVTGVGSVMLARHRMYSDVTSILAEEEREAIEVLVKCPTR